MTGGAGMTTSTRLSRREASEEPMGIGSSISVQAQPVSQRAAVQQQSGTWIGSGHLSLLAHIMTRVDEKTSPERFFRQRIRLQ